MNKNVISCDKCSQKLRIPVFDKEIIVSCPCGSKIECIDGQIRKTETLIYKTSCNTYSPSTGLVSDSTNNIVGLWINMKKEQISKILVEYTIIDAERQGYLKHEDALILWVDADLGYRLISNTYDGLGGTFILFNSNLAPGEKVNTVDNFIGKKGERNLSIKGAKKLTDMFLSYECPTCGIPVSLELEKINKIDGATCRCINCENICFIPGSFCDSTVAVEEVPITAGVLVPIKGFGEWFTKHPAFQKMVKCGNIAAYMHDGVFAFCRKCYHQFSPSVINSFSIANQLRGFVFNAKSENSEIEMNALLSGNCPKCDSSNLIVIFAEFDLTPERIKFLEDNKRKL